MSLLTQGLAGPALAERGIAAAPQGEVQGAPSPILSGGLGRITPQTARPTRFNTPVTTFYHGPVSEVAEWNAPGSVSTLANGDPSPAIHRAHTESGPIRATHSARPYENWGTAFGLPRGNGGVGTPIPQAAYVTRHGSRGDLEYAVWNGDPRSMYNARSITIYTPDNVFLSPRSINRLDYLLGKVREYGVTLRLIRGNDIVKLEQVGNVIHADYVAYTVNGTRRKIKLDSRYDVVSEQTYSGMGD